MKRITHEEKVARKLLDLVNDYTIDLELTGIYLYQIAPFDLFENLDIISNAMKEAERREYERQNANPLF